MMRPVFVRSSSAAATGIVLLLAFACGPPDDPPPFQIGDFDAGVTEVFEPTFDPVTCEEARQSRSYVGCEYWPTVTANAVWSIFDFVAVVANTGAQEASVTATGPGGINKVVTVPPGELRRIYLPWVPTLKGDDGDSCTDQPTFAASVLEPGGAYHIVSTVPVIVYQFNALEYRGQGGEALGGGPKNWASCPGNAACASLNRSLGCFSFSNDASLLLPSTALTGSYRITGYTGWSENTGPVHPATLTVTATQPGTDVTVLLGPKAEVMPSLTPGIAATPGGGTLTFTLANAGDVAELTTPVGADFDFSGSLVQSSKPVQVIAGVPCVSLPANKSACDHVEESVQPAETLGKRYFIHPPTGPKGGPVPHLVRFYGNRDGTMLTYQPGRPGGCPATLRAGEVVDCGLVDDAFEVNGTNEFGVASFLLSAQQLSPAGDDPRGDPDQTSYASVEQFRTKYIFLAPDDYAVNYVDVTTHEDSGVEVDGKLVIGPWTRIGNGPYGVRRVSLEPRNGGAHVLTSRKPVGIQVLGYGDFTSYEYPGGLNLKLIAPPPPPVR